MIRVAAGNVNQALKRLAEISEKKANAALINALNWTAFDTRDHLHGQMADVFDRPTRWTTNSLFVWKAKPKSPAATVRMKNEATKSNPATKWLAPQIFAGRREDKRSERHLRARHILPQGKSAVPAEGAKLDRHGNMTKGQITKILSGIGGFDESGFDANATGTRRSAAKGNAKRYFVIRKGRQNIGIAERFKRGPDGIRMVMAFVRPPNYQQGFDFFGDGQRFASKKLVGALDRAIKRELRR